jgi:hypothetical protein
VTNPLDEILTLDQAAALLGRSASTLRHQAKAMQLNARRLGGVWLTTRSEVARYRGAQLGQAGRRPAGMAPGFAALGMMATLMPEPNPCPRCADLAYRLFEPTSAPDLPIEACTRSGGCACRWD